MAKQKEGRTETTPGTPSFQPISYVLGTWITSRELHRGNDHAKGNPSLVRGGHPLRSAVRGGAGPATAAGPAPRRERQGAGGGHLHPVPPAHSVDRFLRVHPPGMGKRHRLHGGPGARANPP